jgi:dihydroorotate dehydrogenase electron transfer subunit
VTYTASPTTHDVPMVRLPVESDARSAPGWSDAPVVAQHQCGDRYWSLELHAPHVATAAQPGQFVMITPRGEDAPGSVLPRPMAVSAVDRLHGNILIIYGVVGAGTRQMATLQRGESVVVVGPLGRAFDVGPEVRSILLLGRGVGICSLALLAVTAHQRGCSVLAVSSGRAVDAIVGREVYQTAGISCREVYDADGSSDPKGLRQWLSQRYQRTPADLVAVCGSVRLISMAHELVQSWGSDMQVSIEARMACGLGYCHGCSTAGVGDITETPLVCQHGPVFRVPT